MKLHKEQNEPSKFWIGSKIKKIYIDYSTFFLNWRWLLLQYRYFLGKNFVCYFKNHYYVISFLHYTRWTNDCKQIWLWPFLAVKQASRQSYFSGDCESEKWRYSYYHFFNVLSSQIRLNIQMKIAKIFRSLWTF